MEPTSHNRRAQKATLTGTKRQHAVSECLPISTAARHEAMPAAKAGEIIRKGVQPFGIVPFALLEYHALSPLARLVAVWIESKPEGWIVRPGVLQKALGITEKQWLAARKAMIKAGIFTHRKHRKASGKWAWTSEFDASAIVKTIPPLAAHGEPANIELRANKQYTEVIRAYAPDDSKPVSRTTSRANENLHELKKIHIGHVLDALEIPWWQEGDYVKWNDHDRARKADDGHWLWYRVDGRGEPDNSGSAIDLLMDHEACSQAEAISHLRHIHKTVTEGASDAILRPCAR